MEKNETQILRLNNNIFVFKINRFFLKKCLKTELLLNVCHILRRKKNEMKKNTFFEYMMSLCINV